MTNKKIDEIHLTTNEVQLYTSISRERERTMKTLDQSSLQPSFLQQSMLRIKNLNTIFRRTTIKFCIVSRESIFEWELQKFNIFISLFNIRLLVSSSSANNSDNNAVRIGTRLSAGTATSWIVCSHMEEKKSGKSCQVRD